MESTLKGEIFENGIYRKRFTPGFFTDEWIENSFDINTPHVSGVVEEFQLDGLFVVITDLNAAKDYSCEVSNDFSIFKLHFEISGSYAYTPHEWPKPLVQIPDFHCNMFYLPRTNGRLDYSGVHRRTLEVFFTKDLIEKMAGDTFKLIFRRINNAVENNDPFIFWTQARPISLNVGRILEDVIECPYDGPLKKTYLKSKLTSLLLDFLIAANSEPKSNPDLKLSEKDIDGLKRVEQYIGANLKQDLQIAELSQMAGFNATKLKRDFKQVYGATVFQFITRLRMEKAGELISAKNLSVAQAAYEVGYSNPQHFTKAFKRTMGYLPSILKK